MVLAVASVLGLDVPWGATPRDVPLPIFERRALARVTELDEARFRTIDPILAEDARLGATGPLFDLRALGTQLRAYGRADHDADADTIVRERRLLAEALAAARPLGDDKLLALRAYEAHWFLREVAQWEASGTESPDLVGLGGSFVRMAERSGWSSRGRLDMPEYVRAVFFKKRWNALLGLREPGSFGLLLDEERAFYAYLLSHGWVDSSAPAQVPVAESCRTLALFHLRKVQELAQLDPTYPVHLARGVLLFRAGSYLEAANAFREQLNVHPDGPYRIRARNYLRTTLARAAESP